MPSRELGDFLVAHWAHSVLVLPKVQELSFSGEVLLCFHVKTFFKVGFPSRVEWVGSPLNGRVPLDFHLGGSPEVNNLRVSFLVPDFSCKHPIVRTLGCEVFLPYPGCAFLWVSSPGPPPEFFKDCTIHGVKGFAAGSKSMVICPSSYYWVQSRRPRTFFMNAFPFFLEGVVNTPPFLDLRTCCPRKSKPSLICVISVFSCDN